MMYVYYRHIVDITYQITVYLYLHHAVHTVSTKCSTHRVYPSFVNAWQESPIMQEGVGRQQQL